MELAARLDLERLSGLSNRRLHLILMPTERCDFRCVYCYEDFVAGRMPRAVIDGVIALIERRAPTLDRLELEWFGGEPLLALDVIEEVSRRVLAQQEQRPQLVCSGAATTNGYRLDLETAARLVALGVRGFQVSLDGAAAHHDRTRVRAGGQPTFTRIWDNLMALRRSALDVEVLVRLHLTPENVADAPAFVDHLRATLLDDPRFGLLLKPIEHLGGANDHAFAVLDERRLPASLGRLHEITRAGEASGPQICYAAKANSFVIRSQGQVCKCTVALDEPRNQVGQLHADGTLTVAHERLRPWLGALLSGDATTLACPLVEIPQALTGPRPPRSLPIVQA